MSKSSLPLDYSSPAQERERSRLAEDERRGAIEAYNQATFGDKRPLGSFLLRTAAALGVAFLLILLLPRPYGRIAASVPIIALAVWEWRRSGFSTTGAHSLRPPFHWW